MDQRQQAGRAYLFHWVTGPAAGGFAEEVKVLWDQAMFPTADAGIMRSFGALDNIATAVGEAVSKLEPKELWVFPCIDVADGKDLAQLDGLELLLDRFQAARPVVIFPLLFVEPSISTDGIRERMTGLSARLGRTMVVTSKFRNGLDAQLPVDWLVIFRGFVEMVAANEKSGGRYARDLADLSGIVSIGVCSLEQSVRPMIDRALAESFHEYCRDQLERDKPPFDFKLQEVAGAIEAEIAQLFKSYTVPAIRNPFRGVEPEEFRELLSSVDPKKQADEAKLKAESQRHVEEAFREMLSWARAFGTSQQVSVREKLDKTGKAGLQKIRGAVTTFLNNGNTLYSVEKWLRTSLADLKSGTEPGTVFNLRSIINDKLGRFVPGLRELCRRLRKLEEWKKIPGKYAWFFVGLLVLFVPLSLVVAYKFLHVAASAESVLKTMGVGLVLALIGTGAIYWWQVRKWTKRCEEALDELAKMHVQVADEVAKALIGVFRDFAIRHFVSKVQRRLGTFLGGLSETCAVYRRVLERTTLAEFSFGQSRLVRTVRGLSSVEDDMVVCASEAFNDRKGRILARLFDVGSENQVKSEVRDVLADAEKAALDAGRGKVRPEDFPVTEDQVRSDLLDRVLDYVAYPLPPDFKGAQKGFLCKPERVAASGTTDWHELDWDRGEAITAVVIVTGIGGKADTEV